MRDSANFSYLIIAYRRGIYNGDMGRPRGRGQKNYNRTLSSNRANAVLDYLMTTGCRFR